LGWTLPLKLPAFVPLTANHSRRYNLLPAILAPNGGKLGRTIRIVPAILTEDPSALKAMTSQARTFCDYVQFDIMDGEFVPSRSVSANDIAALRATLTWEAHLMVRRPEDYFADFKQAGAARVIFHYEATDKPIETIAAARAMGLGIGMAVNPDTNISDISPLIENIDSVLFMSVNPGFYGSPFIPAVLDSVAELRRRYPNIEIGMDGGISKNNIEAVARSGADYLCVGSAIFRQPDPAESYRKLVALANTPIEI
jgi:ribulose-phosphate 3-epimerase